MVLFRRIYVKISSNLKDYVQRMLYLLVKRMLKDICVRCFFSNTPEGLLKPRFLPSFVSFSLVLP